MSSTLIHTYIISPFYWLFTVALIYSYCRPPPNLGDSLGGRYPSNAWQPMSPKNAGPSSQAANTFGSHLSTRDGVGTSSSSAVSFAVIFYGLALIGLAMTGVGLQGFCK